MVVKDSARKNGAMLSQAVPHDDSGKHPKKQMDREPRTG